jgi:hypothetical protein
MKVNTFPPSILFAVTGQFLLVETLFDFSIAFTPNIP